MHRVTGLRVTALGALILLAGAVRWLAGPATAATPEKAIPRFHKVNDTLYRGGMPQDGGWGLLEEMGVATVVTFRNESPERALVESLGMRHVAIPLTATQGVPGHAIQEFFKVMREPWNHPVFVHCRRGADRTGAMVAFYRIAFEGWDPERAYREARDIGLRWWYFKLRKQIRQFGPEPFSGRIPEDPRGGGMRRGARPGPAGAGTGEGLPSGARTCASTAPGQRRIPAGR